MAWADDVREQVSGFAGGTGAATLTGTPVSGEQSFLSGWGASGQGIAKWKMGTQWEIAWCSLNVGGTLITRLETIRSSTGTTTITFSAGTLDITGVAPADWVETRDTEDYLINGNGQVQQVALAAIADDVYGHDQWYALNQSNPTTPSQLTDVEDGLPQMIRLTQSNASDQRHGYAQIIEGQRCKKLRGKRVTFGGRLRNSNAAAVRFAILEWTGTVDAVTSDVVNDWTSGTFTAGNFFNSTTLTVRAVGTITPSAATLTDFRLSATLGSSFNNLVVIIWVAGTAAQNSTLDFAAQLKRGFVVAPYVFRSSDQENTLCRRFFRRDLTPPLRGIIDGSTTTQADRMGMQLVPQMRSAPTATLNGSITVFDGSTTRTISSLAVTYCSADVAEFDIALSGALTALRLCLVLNLVGAGSIDLNSRL